MYNIYMLSFLLNALYTLKEAIRAPFLLWFNADGWVWSTFDLLYDIGETFGVFTFSMVISVAVTTMLESLFMHYVPRIKSSYKAGTCINDFCSWFKISSNSLITKINSFINKFFKK